MTEYTEQRQFFVHDQYVTVNITGQWRATSPDFPAWSVEHPNKRILIAMVAEALDKLVPIPGRSPA